MYIVLPKLINIRTVDTPATPSPNSKSCMNEPLKNNDTKEGEISILIHAHVDRQIHVPCQAP